MHFAQRSICSFDLHFLAHSHAHTAQKKMMKDRIQELLDRQSGLPQPTFAQRFKAMFGWRRHPQGEMSKHV
jgi:hypothetical protein